MNPVSGGAATMSTARVERRSAVVATYLQKRAFVIASAIVFAVSAAITVAWCTSMSAMGEMPMPGGWTMSMTWMRMWDRHGRAPRRRSSGCGS